MAYTFFGPLFIQILNFKDKSRLMQKAYLFALQIVMPAANSYSAFQLHFRISKLSKTVGKGVQDIRKSMYFRLSNTAQKRSWKVGNSAFSYVRKPEINSLKLAHFSAEYRKYANNLQLTYLLPPAQATPQECSRLSEIRKCNLQPELLFAMKIGQLFALTGFNI